MRMSRYIYRKRQTDREREGEKGLSVLLLSFDTLQPTVLVGTRIRSVVSWL